MAKALTRAQLASRKAKAVRFVRDVLGDPDRASEIEEESLEDYAARRKIRILDNPRRRSTVARISKTKAELEAELQEAEDYIEELESKLDEIAGIVEEEEPEEEDLGEEEG